MKTFYSAIVVIFFILLIMTSINIIGKNSLDNTNINDDSVLILATINSSLETDYNTLNLTEETSLNDTSAEDKDSFGFEFLTAKSSAEKKVSIVNVLKTSPTLAVASTGADNADFKPYINIFEWFIAITLLVVLFLAIFKRKVSDED